ncbi:MAG: Glycerophosphodiester phosphodiesterase [Parcubacteria group bacterium GW2011_GWA2_45_30]|nr:MAG: Glycerophosphodiester phosphodiesterase [Parcubacteria group bacterium GW2011_GWA2_45_30]
MLKFGHRGAPGFPRYGENTIGSFGLALLCGANAIELDVRRTKDGVPVVIHDETIDRTTNGSGKVGDILYRDLKLFQTDNGETIPTFAQVLDRFDEKFIFINAEAKEAGVAQEIGRIASAWEMEKNVIVSAFDTDDNDPDSSSSWEDLTKMKVLYPNIPIALLATTKKIKYLGYGEFVARAKEKYAHAIHPPYGYILEEPDLVNVAHSAKMRIHVWTVNSRWHIWRMKRLGVDGIISDFPQRL